PPPPRTDELTPAALEAPLRASEGPPAAVTEIPTLRMLAEPATAIRRRAQKVLRRVPGAVRAALGLTVVGDRSQVGGGALPLVELPTAALSLGTPAHPAEELDRPLRAGRPPVVGR